MSRRLYLQIYAAFVGVALLCLLVAWAAAKAVGEDRGVWVPRFVAAGAELIAEAVPPGLDASSRRSALRARARQLGVRLALWDARGEPLGTSDGRDQEPCVGCSDAEWLHHRGIGGVRVRLADGRFLTVRAPRGPRRHGKLLLVLVAVFGAMAAGCYPVARRITRRLEALDGAMAKFSAGALDHRAEVHGRDEVAGLARGFNAAADSIAGLIAQHKRTLAAASHELRSPLSRLRLAVELQAQPQTTPERRKEILREVDEDVEELDRLIDELLVAARLDAFEETARRQRVDFGDLCAREAGRVGVPVTRLSGDPGELAVMGDATLLRRLARNLLDNALRHGVEEVELALDADASNVRLEVLDRGPGVPTHDAERIFEAFYRPVGRPEGQGGGIGLGLALVSQIAVKHGGEASYATREGGGSRFVVTLPLWPSAEPGAQTT